MYMETKPKGSIHIHSAMICPSVMSIASSPKFTVVMTYLVLGLARVNVHSSLR